MVSPTRSIPGCKHDEADTFPAILDHAWIDTSSCFEDRSMSARAKGAGVVVVVGLIASGALVYRSFSAISCPQTSKRWQELKYPTSSMSDASLLSFVKSGPALGEVERWTRATNCSGERELVGRVLTATVEAKSQEVLLASLYGAVIDSEKGRSRSEMAGDLSALFSSEVAKQVFDSKLLVEKVSEVGVGEIKFARGLLDILSEPLDVETNNAFQKEVLVDRLAKQK